VWSVILGYTIALVFWWTPSSSQVMRLLSFPVWMAFVIYLASIAGVYRVPLFLVIVALTIVGFITEANGSKDQGKHCCKCYQRLAGVVALAIHFSA
jgi:hypothetical protein